MGSAYLNLCAILTRLDALPSRFVYWQLKQLVATVIKSMAKFFHDFFKVRCMGSQDHGLLFYVISFKESKSAGVHKTFQWKLGWFDARRFVHFLLRGYVYRSDVDSTI